MGLVKYALKYRISFYVLSILTLFLGGSAIVAMPKDVLPVVNIPVVSIIWTLRASPPRRWSSGSRPIRNSASPTTSTA
jgi:multidrug efflux pump subunit AcrB